MRVVALLLVCVAVALLAGCGIEAPLCPAVSPVVVRDCPRSVAVPAPLPRVHTQDQLAEFAITLELAREKERARGDACAR